ncbi:patatin-like phospholipase family protein [Bacteroides sp. 214]|uniref:patatin-like phospholipase family protein n=1 Tax=Bacteroides sp. 214 TaxID=2302935 RepID=UPI0013D4D1A5|nr:patatin-like phospholipase family protein [Bacteroides sp. 214]
MSANSNLKIALTFSGGGYRAATFHLGVLSYLYSFKLDEGSLLDRIHAMSTISGGTITGLRYMLGVSRNELPEEIFKKLYHFLTEVDLPTTAMNHLHEKDKGQTVSLIRTMANIYNDKLFDGARFGEVMDGLSKNHIQQFSANATDFVNALPFRFQATAGRQESNTGYGIIGNYSTPISRTIAKHIRLSEILACSSCFPSGFEPLMFPTDFDLGDSQEVKEYIAKREAIGIMDGGIVDNQGIEPIILADDRMVKAASGEKEAGFDLVIISDVASPYMDAYKTTDVELPAKLNKLTLKKLSSFLWAGGFAMTLLTGLSFYFAPGSFISGVLFAVWAIVAALLVYYSILKNKVLDLIKGSIIKNSFQAISNLKVGDIATLVVNRVNSVLMLTTTVFMKHLRRMNYRTAYNKESWNNRVIMNGVYELRPGESWVSKLKKKEIPEYLKPSEAIQQTSEKAASMGTTLWFSEEDKKNGVHDALVATGQYTICFNLLEYIYLIKKNPVNLNEQHHFLISLEERLKADWEEFQKNPMCKKTTSI